MDKGEGAMVEDVEEGEISDSASVEEISKEDYVKHGTAAKVSLKESNRESRVWTMRDLYENYPTVCRGYTSDLYSLAWAQAVQNKPLNEIFVLDVDAEKNAKRPTSPSVNCKEDAKSVKEVEEVVIDDIEDEIDVDIINAEKEEEELEEGEIDLDSEPVEIEGKACKFVNDENINVEISEVNSKQMELENQLKLIQEALEKMNDAKNSFEDVCSLLCGTLERLLNFSSENNFLEKDVLIQHSFATIQLVCSAFHSMSHRQKEVNKHMLLRLLVCMKKDKLSIFSPVQMKEMEEVILCASVDSLASLKTFGDRDKEIDDEGITASNTDINISQPNKFLSSITSTNLPPDYVDVSSVVHNSRNLSSGVSTFKSRGALLPLLDLHKEHDADSLPSPTRETSIRFPVHKALVVEETHGVVKSQSSPFKAVLDSGHSRTRAYETDAIKAVSSYQQKFGQSSSFMNDRLPSPTPSEEHVDGGDDISEEYSSSDIAKNTIISNPPILNKSVVNPGSCVTAAVSPNIDNCGSQAMRTMTNVALVSCISNPAIKRSAKSRDPRLRYLNDPGSDLITSSLPVIHSTSKVEPAGVTCSGKQKIYDEPKFDCHASKRQKIDEIPSLVKDGKPNYGIGGWLEDTDSDAHQLIKNQLVENSETELTNKIKVVNSSYSVNANAKDSVNERVLNATTGISISLPALLKDIAVNPAMLINLLQKGQQQQLAAESLQKYSEPEICANIPNSNSNSILGAAPLVSGVSSLTSGILQKPDPGTLPIHSQSTSMDEVGKIRMKPRDPRRILHTNILQRNGSSGNEQFKMCVPIASSSQGSKDSSNGQNPNGQNQEDEGDNVVLLPDIARQFTKNLKNIADIISVSKAPSISQNLQLQSVSGNLDKKDIKADDSDSEGHPAGINSAPALRQMGTSYSQSTWEDVEHLFEGFDDHQKAAIQRERVRRMGEQKKMFAGRKLSLVLDLDHTLLNSAKFLEVDPVHDEILRKKEEQDREKQQRQLFRLPHMGMWTKLRPGIWNFLEKASKLYELHLYTMGNKLYATEMAKVLDPTKCLFSGRVISRGDDGDLLDGDDRIPKTKDLEGVLGMESSVVIVDDSVRVWPHNKLNLIVVERYTYFPCSRRQFGLFGPSLLEIDHDERPEDGTLASSLAVIERIHQNFFSHQSLDEADVRNILAMEQRKILANCCILFSRVFPVGEANPHLHGLWKTAEQFGAVCTNHIDEQVTHVVANSLGTNKVNWALSTGRFVVHPGWTSCCGGMKFERGVPDVELVSENILILWNRLNWRRKQGYSSLYIAKL